jgi:hypothetical protein
MELNIDPDILKAYGFSPGNISVQQIGSGHINSTYLLSLTDRPEQYILQHINQTGICRPKCNCK